MVKPNRFSRHWPGIAERENFAWVVRSGNRDIINKEIVRLEGLKIPPDQVNSTNALVNPEVEALVAALKVSLKRTRESVLAAARAYFELSMAIAALGFYEAQEAAGCGIRYLNEAASLYEE